MRVPALVSTAVVGCVLFAGCGDSGSPPAGPSPPVAPPSTVIEVVGDRGAQSFTPNPATPGNPRTVAFRNTHTEIHRMVANDGSWDTGNVGAGGTSAAITIPAAGANYHCSLHPGMIGAIAGTSGEPPPCTGPYCGD